MTPTGSDRLQELRFSLADITKANDKCSHPYAPFRSHIQSNWKNVKEFLNQVLYLFLIKGK
jgi:hypothetical protein